MTTTTDKLTAETITARQIRQLRDQAEVSGDECQIDLCDLALVGTDDAPKTEARTERFLRAWLSLADEILIPVIETALNRRPQSRGFGATHDEIMTTHARLGRENAARSRAVYQARQRCADAINATRAQDDSAEACR